VPFPVDSLSNGALGSSMPSFGPLESEWDRG
jgi:hypothetical protein